MPRLSDNEVEIRLRILSHSRDAALALHPDSKPKEFKALWTELAKHELAIFKSLQLEKGHSGSAGRGNEPKPEPRMGDATVPQVRAIMSISVNRGIERADVRKYAGTVLGKEVDSIAGLTKREASKVIDALKAA